MLSTNLGTSTRIFLTVFIIILISSYTYVYVYGRDIDEEFLSLYREIVDLARKGVYVSHIVSNLSVVLEIAEQEQNSNRPNANELMRFVRETLEELKKEISRITLHRNIVKLLTVIFLSSMPIIFYIFFPRLYLYTWFITRRKWVIRNESAR